MYCVNKRTVLICPLNSFIIRCPPHALHSMDGFAEALGQEVQLEFTRSMNRILLDKTVADQPGLFPTVTLPDPHVEIVPRTGMCLVCNTMMYCQ